jgi:hypothetical protein
MGRSTIASLAAENRGMLISNIAVLVDASQAFPHEIAAGAWRRGFVFGDVIVDPMTEDSPKRGGSSRALHIRAAPVECLWRNERDAT